MKITDLVGDDRLPYFQCFPGKLLGALSAMSASEQVVYVVVILRIYEVRGPCPDSLDAIARRTHLTKRRVTDALDVLFRTGKLERDPGGIHNPFARDVIAAVASIRGERKNAGAKGGKRRAENRKGNQPEGPSKPQANPSYRESEKEKNLFSDENRTSAAPTRDPEDVRTKLFRQGLDALARMTGRAPNALRSMIGRWLKGANDDALRVLRAIEDAEQNRAADPLAWVERALAVRRGTGQAFESRNGAAALLADMMNGGGDHAERGDDEAVDHRGALPAGAAGGADRAPGRRPAR